MGVSASTDHSIKKNDALKFLTCRKKVKTLLKTMSLSSSLARGPSNNLKICEGKTADVANSRHCTLRRAQRIPAVAAGVSDEN